MEVSSWGSLFSYDLAVVLIEDGLEAGESGPDGLADHGLLDLGGPFDFLLQFLLGDALVGDTGGGGDEFNDAALEAEYCVGVLLVLGWQGVLEYAVGEGDGYLSALDG